MTSAEALDLEQTLAAVRLPHSAAFAHGLLTGCLVADATMTETDLVAALGQAEAPTPTALTALHHQVARWRALLVRDLQAEDIRFMPLLPEDNVAIAERAQALSEWVQGFLGGLGQTRRHGGLRPSAQATEILRDFAQIALVDADPEATEVNEMAWMELVEYLRVGVLTLADELADSSSG